MKIKIYNDEYIEVDEDAEEIVAGDEDDEEEDEEEIEIDEEKISKNIMPLKPHFYKEHKNDKIWWYNDFNALLDTFIFTFDKKEYFNLLRDYPYKLTPEQKAIFDKENPIWANYFKTRVKNEKD